MGQIKKKIDKEKLENLYVKKHFPSTKIAKLFKCHPMTVRNRLREFRIPIRSSSEARMRYEKYNFSSDSLEKAYILGFRLGDLNVYQTTKVSPLIIVRCHTTQKVQVELIESLFSQYGKVTISQSQYGININCFLNRSFSFLLNKIKNVPKWVKNNEKTSFAFIAGYIDAEGNFLLNQAKARFKVDSYDVGILTWIAHWLRKQEIKTKLRCINKAGELRRNGAKFKHDLWRLNINEAFSLLNFIKKIRPFIRHKTRLEKMVICERNIRQRIRKLPLKYATN